MSDKSKIDLSLSRAQRPAHEPADTDAPGVTLPLSRADRRQLKHRPGKFMARFRKQKPLSNRLTMAEVASQFAAYDMFFQQLDADSVPADQEGALLMRDDMLAGVEDHKRWFRAAHVLDGWCDVWSRIARLLGAKVDVSPMAELARVLDVYRTDDPATHGLLTDAIIEPAKAALEQARAYAMVADAYKLGEVSRITQIAIAEEMAGYK